MSNRRHVRLRRALILAGTRAQLTTLWRVDDDAMRDAMVEYYERFAAGPGSRCRSA